MSLMAQEKFCIAKDGKAATIIVDENDWKGVIRAARDLGDDIRKVTGVKSSLEFRVESGEFATAPHILVRTIGKSKAISQLIKQ